ncbi:MAG TPA: alkaline phosphatase [Ignavibacteriaceae bacterium]|nr:alkaline phosphatase [Ignavibacteriaceae bacterium]
MFFRNIFFLLLFCASFIGAQQKPKNIILLIGDGMGTNSVSASVYADKTKSPFRRFTSVGFSITTSLNKFITDSGAGGTAVATGYRTNYTWISMDPKDNKPLYTILEKAEDLKKSTGVVVTSSITNATPAAFLSHVKNRALEFDIANQIAEKDVEVLIGAGTDFFFDKSHGGSRPDSLGDLTVKLQKKNYTIIKDVNSLLSYNKDNKVIALLDSFGLPAANSRNYNLSELVNKSLEILSKDKDGFFLMVEGSQIDWGLHDHLDDYWQGEMKDFAGAIDAALNFADKDGNTLVVVTSDHETGGLSINGGTLQGDSLKFSYTTAGHTAAMVGIFAKGPGAEEFSGVMDNYMIGRKLFLLFDKKSKFPDK